VLKLIRGRVVTGVQISAIKVGEKGKIKVGEESQGRGGEPGKVGEVTEA